jgi:hypothetical protein
MKDNENPEKYQSSNRNHHGHPPYQKIAEDGEVVNPTRLLRGMQSPTSAAPRSAARRFSRSHGNVLTKKDRVSRYSMRNPES